MTSEKQIKEVEKIIEGSLRWSVPGSQRDYLKNKIREVLTTKKEIDNNKHNIV